FQHVIHNTVPIHFHPGAAKENIPFLHPSPSPSHKNSRTYNHRSEDNCSAIINQTTTMNAVVNPTNRKLQGLPDKNNKTCGSALESSLLDLPNATLVDAIVPSSSNPSLSAAEQPLNITGISPLTTAKKLRTPLPSHRPVHSAPPIPAPAPSEIHRKFSPLPSASHPSTYGIQINTAPVPTTGYVGGLGALGFASVLAGGSSAAQRTAAPQKKNSKIGPWRPCRKTREERIGRLRVRNARFEAGFEPYRKMSDDVQAPTLATAPAPYTSPYHPIIRSDAVPQSAFSKTSILPHEDTPKLAASLCRASRERHVKNLMGNIVEGDYVQQFSRSHMHTAASSATSATDIPTNSRSTKGGASGHNLTLDIYDYNQQKHSRSAISTTATTATTAPTFSSSTFASPRGSAATCTQIEITNETEATDDELEEMTKEDFKLLMRVKRRRCL
ncbi:hypothetical protein BGZ60DRAFT_553125, partial [Tricladium varicosporioides]